MGTIQQPSGVPQLGRLYFSVPFLCQEVLQCDSKKARPAYMLFERGVGVPVSGYAP